MREMTSPTRSPPRARHSRLSKRQSDSWIARPSRSISRGYSSHETYRSFTRRATRWLSLERMMQHDRLVAIRAGRDQIDRNAEHLGEALEIAPCILWQFFPVTNPEGRFRPTGELLVNRLTARDRIGAIWKDVDFGPVRTISHAEHRS